MTQPTDQSSREQEREAFEAWLTADGDYEQEWLDGRMTSAGWLYSNADTENMFNAWQARASLAEQRTRAMREALQNIANVLGAGPCDDNTCQGCRFEHREAASIARAAISTLPPTAITAEEAGREGDAKDAARLDWLAEQDGCNLVSDDAGRWQVSDAGMQPVPPDGGFKEDVSIVSIAFHENWKPTIREAIDAAMLPPAPAQSGGQGNG